MMKKGRKPIRKKVSWFGTVKMRLSNGTGFGVVAGMNEPKVQGRLIELGQKVGHRLSHFTVKHLCERGNFAARLIQGDPLHPQHGKKQGRQPHSLALRMLYLTHKFV